MCYFKRERRREHDIQRNERIKERHNNRIMRASGNNEAILLKKDCLKEANETREAHYLLSIEQVNLNAIRLAQKEDVYFYILNKRKIIDQREREH